jgi:hypothetical protein
MVTQIDAIHYCRAGRDGKPAVCILYASVGDASRHLGHGKAAKALDVMRFATTHRCRRDELATHYNEHGIVCRDGCDNCRAPPTLLTSSVVDACARALLQQASHASAKTTPLQLVRQAGAVAAVKTLSVADRNAVLAALLVAGALDVRSAHSRYGGVCYVALSPRGRAVRSLSCALASAV